MFECLQFNEFIDYMYNFVIGIDNDNKIIMYNQACERFVGLPKSEIIGKNIENVKSNSRLKIIIKAIESNSSNKFFLDDRFINFTRMPLIQQGVNEGEIVVFSDIKEIEKIEKQLDMTEKNLEALEILIDSTYEGIIIVDEKGYITKFNKTYQEFLNLDPDKVIGKHVTDVIENTRMHIVVKTGKIERGHVQRIQGHDMIASRFPIRKDGKIIGAVGKVLFQDVKELEALAKRMPHDNNHFNYYKKELKKLQEAKYSFENIITANPRMNSLKKIGLQAAEGFSTVLLTGESGTGKELFAHAIHKASCRKYGAFVRVNCSAIPKDLLESELFGYEKGAFTGAKKEGKAGKFEMANGGTIFLDEIGTMPLGMQVKILRVLQEREVERVGSNRTIELDIRVIAATNENLYKLIENGKFRKDLFYRLNVIKIDIPSLRERREDIVLLAKHVLNEFIDSMDLGPITFENKTLELMKGYDWPGNIRELRNYVERSIYLSNTNKILPENIPEIMNGASEKIFNDSFQLSEIIEKAEYQAIKKMLRQTNNNKTETAKMLGIHRTSLYNKMNKYGLK